MILRHLTVEIIARRELCAECGQEIEPGAVAFERGLRADHVESEVLCKACGRLEEDRRSELGGQLKEIALRHRLAPSQVIALAARVEGDLDEAAREPLRPTVLAERVLLEVAVGLASGKPF